MRNTKLTDDEYDFIVVGAGSAGAVVASRLSEGGTARVLLLEAGPRDTSFWIHLPIGFSKTFRHPRVNWMHESDPEPELLDRRMYWPKGKVLGGSSSINGLIHVRGLPSDYEHWRARGNPRWSYEEVEPYFRRLEGSPDKAHSPEGQGGQMPMCPTSWRTELSEAFIASAHALTGARREDGFNQGHQLGAGYFMLTESKGWRSSSATAYLKPARGRPNLRVVTGALAHRVEFTGTTARRVVYVKAGRTHFACARREIILSGGAINTPQLLQLSGVGPADVMRRAGVQLLQELPGVGRDLHDHFTTRFTVSTNQARTTLNGVAGNWVGKARVAFEWATRRAGPLTIGAGVAGAYVKSDQRLAEPDAQFILVPFKTDQAYKGLTADAGFQLLVTPSRPKSRGRLEIRSADPATRPFMIANYLSAEEDRNILVKSLRMARKLLASSSMAPFVKAELSPGPSVSDDAALLRFARESGGSTQHQVGSCQMGNGDLAVVDGELRVHGLDHLRIADASVMPQVVSGNTNGACLMIGERCADFVKQVHSDLFTRTASG